MKSSKIELVKFKLDTNYNDIEFIIGDSFRFFNGEFYLNTSPYSDATLNSIHNIVLNDGVFQFDYRKQTKYYHYKMNLLESEMAFHIADFIQHVNSMNKQYKLNSGNDSFEFLYDKENGIQFSIEKANQNKRLVIYLNQNRNSFLVIVYPEPSKRYELKQCSLDRDTIQIQTVGKNLWDDRDTDVELSFDWHICLQSDLLELIKYLLSTGMRLVNDPR